MTTTIFMNGDKVVWEEGEDDESSIYPCIGEKVSFYEQLWKVVDIVHYPLLHKVVHYVVKS